MTPCCKVVTHLPATEVQAFRSAPTRMAARTTGHSGKPAVPIKNPKSKTINRQSIPIPSLYRTLDEPGSNPLRDAHGKLAAAVRAAYGMPKDADILAFLLALNQACAAREAAGEPVTPPGLPLPVEEHEEFITSDCISVR